MSESVHFSVYSCNSRIYRVFFVVGLMVCRLLYMETSFEVCIFLLFSLIAVKISWLSVVLCRFCYESRAYRQSGEQNGVDDRKVEREAQKSRQSVLLRDLPREP